MDEAAVAEAEAVLAAAGVAMHPLHIAGGEAFPRAVDTEVATGAALEDMLHTKGIRGGLNGGSSHSLLAFIERV